MNALRHGERSARNRATGRLIATANRAIQVLGLLNDTSLGLPFKPTRYLKGALLGDWYRIAARVKHVAENWPDDSDDTGVWTRWLAEHRRLGLGVPFGLPVDAAGVPLLRNGIANVPSLFE